ncbi:MAG: hypothetical protein WAO08_30095, partial [Hyphomicrobiaceae bacterium]
VSGVRADDSAPLLTPGVSIDLRFATASRVLDCTPVRSAAQIITRYQGALARARNSSLTISMTVFLLHPFLLISRENSPSMCSARTCLVFVFDGRTQLPAQA